MEIFDDQPHLIRIAQEEHHRGREQIGGGFVSGHQQLVDDAQHLGGFERLGAFEPCVQQISGQINRAGRTFALPSALEVTLALDEAAGALSCADGSEIDRGSRLSRSVLAVRAAVLCAMLHR